MSTPTNLPDLHWEPSAVLAPFGTRNAQTVLNAIKTLIDNSNYWYVNAHDVGGANTYVEIRQRTAGEGNPAPAASLEKLPNYRILVSTGQTILTNTSCANPGSWPFQVMQPTGIYTLHNPIGGTGALGVLDSFDPYGVGRSSGWMQWGEWGSDDPWPGDGILRWDKIWMVESEEGIFFMSHTTASNSVGAHCCLLGALIDPMFAEEGELFGTEGTVYRRFFAACTNRKYQTLNSNFWQQNTSFPSANPADKGNWACMHLNNSGVTPVTRRENIFTSTLLVDNAGAKILFVPMYFQYWAQNCVGRARQWGAWKHELQRYVYSDGGGNTVIVACGSHSTSTGDTIAFVNP